MISTNQALPCRRPELVACPVRSGASCLVRNRRTGESFALGPQEYFLLARLDGTCSADELCGAFRARFAAPLLAEDLEAFLDLARERGLLQPPEQPAPLQTCAFPQEPPPARFGPRGGQIGRLATWLLAAAGAFLRWFARHLGSAAQKLEWLRLARLQFVPRADDVFIVTYPRSGTTWMQMILYQLATDGAMDFAHIYEYCPWFERSSRSRLAFEGRPSPRLFKTHLPYDKVGKWPCKYIYVARNGKDVAVSYYHLNRSYNGYEGTFDQFFEAFLAGKVVFGSWFEHVKTWWLHRNDQNVLFLRYEDLLSDLEGSVRKIIAFCAYQVAPERIAGIVERCGFAFMKQHEAQFDPLTGSLWEQGLELNGFLRTGKSGGWKERLTPAQQEQFERTFQKQLGGVGIGFESRQSPANARGPAVAAAR